MTLRNPNLTYVGVSFPDNVYEITQTTITPKGEFNDVLIKIVTYTNDSKDHQINPGAQYLLRDLPSDRKLLTLILYQQSLIEQYGDDTFDETLIKDFEVLSP